jgi:septal ring factor EnvC (AmiA/AmiB activator)
MDQLIPPEAVSSAVVLKDQIRECFGRVVYAHKAHEKTADLYLARLARIKLAQIGLSAVTTRGLILTLLGSPEKSTLAAAVSAAFATVLLALNTYTKDLDLGQLAERHKETATRLWSVRKSYLSILTDIRTATITLQEIQERRDALQSKLEEIYAAAPRTLDAAYQKAGIALKEKEELTFSEAEIDRFLAPILRRGNRVAGDKPPAIVGSESQAAPMNRSR